jgi:hypothetical protein
MAHPEPDLEVRHDLLNYPQVFRSIKRRWTPLLS